jgi:hypothetical protein
MRIADRRGRGCGPAVQAFSRSASV